ncbi:superoxide dismutase domain protein, partial [Escherichia coli PA23]
EGNPQAVNVRGRNGARHRLCLRHFHAQSGFSSGGLKAFRWCLLLLPGTPDRSHTVYHGITVRVRQRGFVHQDTLQPLHRAFYRSLTNRINHTHHLRGFEIILRLSRRVRPAATFAHNVPLNWYY